jgi:hypothetical protein
MGFRLATAVTDICCCQIQGCRKMKPETCVGNGDQCVGIDDNWMAYFIVRHRYSWNTQPYHRVVRNHFQHAVAFRAVHDPKREVCVRSG